jgi:hypothetical protein
MAFFFLFQIPLGKQDIGRIIKRITALKSNKVSVARDTLSQSAILGFKILKLASVKTL